MGPKSVLDVVKEHPDFACNFLTHFKYWKECRDMILSSLSDAAKELDKLEDKSSLQSAVGTSVFIAGGMTAVIGVALLPVTFGLSSAGVVGGAITSLSSIATSSTAKVIEYRKVCLLLDKVNRLLRCDHELFRTAISDFLSLLLPDGMDAVSINDITDITYKGNEEMKLRRDSWESFDDEYVSISEMDDKFAELSFLSSLGGDKIPIPSHSGCIRKNSESFFQKFAELRDSIEKIEVQGYDKYFSKPKTNIGTHFQKNPFIKSCSMKAPCNEYDIDDDYLALILDEDSTLHGLKEFSMNKAKNKANKKDRSGRRFSNDIHDSSQMIYPLSSTDGGLPDTEYEAYTEKFRKLTKQFALFGTEYKRCRNLTSVWPEFQRQKTKGKPKSIEILRNAIVALKTACNAETVLYKNLWDYMDCRFESICVLT